jgi:REP element-mobilizing transposase RayT
MDSRTNIFPDQSFAHIYFRCHNKQHFLEPKEIKMKLMVLLAKYKASHGIKIFDFSIMDNHAHLYLWAPHSLAIGNYMRTVLSQVAKMINNVFDRDSQAFRERYQSRIIYGATYSLNVIRYIYGNRYAVGKISPLEDYFCSAHWRLHKPHKIIVNPKDQEEEDNNLLAKLIDDYMDPCILPVSKEEDFTQQLATEAMQATQEQHDYHLFVSSHTIGSPDIVAFRSELIRASRRDLSSPILGAGVSSQHPKPPPDKK